MYCTESLEEISIAMGRHLEFICTDSGMDKDEFSQIMAKHLKFITSRKKKSPETIIKYMKSGIPDHFIISHFGEFCNAVQKSGDNYVAERPKCEISERWATRKVEYLNTLLDLFMKAVCLEFVPQNPPIDVFDRVPNIYNKPNILLIEFVFGSFPEEYIPVKKLDDMQTDIIRTQLRPHLKKFFKGAQAEDEFAIHDARILAFCLKAWPEKAHGRTVLDADHIDQLRIALRQHSKFVLETFGRMLPAPPNLPGMDSWATAMYRSGMIDEKS